MLEDLILYFVSKTKGFITKPQLVKFLYLADLYAVKWTEQQLTQLEWCYYNYGPWDEEIDAALQRLESTICQKPEGNIILMQMCDDSFVIDDSKFSEGLRLMLDNIRKEWAGITSEKISDLLKYVYETAPMMEAKQKYQPQSKIRLNLQLERKKLIEELGV
jgi:hypothetical protein